RSPRAASDIETESLIAIVNGTGAASGRGAAIVRSSTCAPGDCPGSRSRLSAPVQRKPRPGEASLPEHFFFPPRLAEEPPAGAEKRGFLEGRSPSKPPYFEATA